MKNKMLDSDREVRFEIGKHDFLQGQAEKGGFQGFLKIK